ncbi:outer membrane protein [Mucilaginibacter gracilis]|uniref:Outer membrane protein n=2 Tax=Mucilaginibacter gracilis TaxID=423350 RepID=A0A495JA81_9SPHI|nr:outer membrane protein [Mucilaginibacter gracilis]
MKYFKYILPLLLIAISIKPARGQNADSVLTLKQCLDIAIKNNLLVKQSEIQVETSRISYQQARENLLPNLNGDITHSLSDGRSLNPFTNGYLNQQITSGNYSLSSSVVLSNGLTLQNSIRQTSLAYQAGKMDFQQAKDNLTLNLITAYLQVLSNEDQLTQANTQAGVSKNQLARLQILDKDGAVTPSQLYDLKGQYATDQLSVVNAKNAVDISKLTLLQLMNVPYNKNVQLQRQASDQLPSVYVNTADDIYQKALSDLAYVKAATLRRESAEKGVQVAKGALLPTLSLSGSLGTNYSSAATRSSFVDSSVVPTNTFINTPGGGRQSVYTVQQNYNTANINWADQFKNNYGTSISLGLSIPILNYFQNKNKVALAKLNLRNAQYIEQNTRIQLRQNVDQAYANMTAAFERYQLLTDQVGAFGESFRIAEVRFNSGVLTSVDFLVVKGNLDRAKVNLISARYDYLIRSKILDYYQGRLAL